MEDDIQALLMDDPASVFGMSPTASAKAKWVKRKKPKALNNLHNPNDSLEAQLAHLHVIDEVSPTPSICAELLEFADKSLDYDSVLTFQNLVAEHEVMVRRIITESSAQALKYIMHSLQNLAAAPGSPPCWEKKDPNNELRPSDTPNSMTTQQGFRGISLTPLEVPVSEKIEPHIIIEPDRANRRKSFKETVAERLGTPLDAPPADRLSWESDTKTELAPKKDRVSFSFEGPRSDPPPVTIGDCSCEDRGDSGVATARKSRISFATEDTAQSEDEDVDAAMIKMDVKASDTWNVLAMPDGELPPDAEMRTSIDDGDPALEPAEEGPRESSKQAVRHSMFYDTNDLKQDIRHGMLDPEYDVVNAVWIAYDADENKEHVLFKSDLIFIVADNFFCTWFFIEWVVRFGAFRLKRDGMRDRWFVFDSAMAFLMMMEVWVMSLALWFLGTKRNDGGVEEASALKVLSTLKILRMGRMVRLVRHIPELMVVIKGMYAAIRAVSATLLLLLLIVYVFAIGLRKLLDGTHSGDQYFPNVLIAGRFLLLAAWCPDLFGYIEDVWEESVFFALVFLAFVLIGAITIMNMLIGILVGVMNNVATVENEEMLVDFAKKSILSTLKAASPARSMSEGASPRDQNSITKVEFDHLITIPEARTAFGHMGVDAVGLVDYAEFIFKSKHELTFLEFMTIVMQLRGSNQATVKDIVDLRHFIVTEMTRLHSEIADADAHMNDEMSRMHNEIAEADQHAMDEMNRLHEEIHDVEDHQQKALNELQHEIVTPLEGLAEISVKDAKARASAVVKILCVCGNQFLDDSRFCRKCGLTRPNICSCGNIMKEDSMFCRNCGKARDKAPPRKAFPVSDDNIFADSFQDQVDQKKVPRRRKSFAKAGAMTVDVNAFCREPRGDCDAALFEDEKMPN